MRFQSSFTYVGISYYLLSFLKSVMNFETSPHAAGSPRCPPPHDGDSDNSLIPPPLQNRLPLSQFLPDFDGSSGKIYLQPLANASIT